MNRTDPQTPPALRALCQLAGEQAVAQARGGRQGAAAVTTGAGAAPARTRLVQGALLGGCGLLTLAVLAAHFGGRPALNTPPLLQRAAALPQTLQQPAFTPASARPGAAVHAPTPDAHAVGFREAGPAQTLAPAAPAAPVDATVPGEIESQPDGAC